MRHLPTAPCDARTIRGLLGTSVIAAAAEQDGCADWGNRSSRKVPIARYGTRAVERVTLSRQTATLTPARKISKASGLSTVAAESREPSSKSRRSEAPLTDATALVAVVA